MTTLRSIIRRLYTIVMMPDFVMGVGECDCAPCVKQGITRI